MGVTLPDPEIAHRTRPETLIFPLIRRYGGGISILSMVFPSLLGGIMVRAARRSAPRIWAARSLSGWVIILPDPTPPLL